MQIDAVSSILGSENPLAVKPKDDPAKIKEAAKQFEALLMGQMMKSMREAEGGWLGTGEDKSAASAMDYGQEIFAQSLASSGGLGLARLVSDGLQNNGVR